MARRTRYYYDEDACGFKEEQITTGEIIKQALVITGASLVLSSLIVAGYFFFSNDDPRVIDLKEKNRILTTKFEEVNVNLGQLKDAIGVIYTDHNQLRAQFAAPAITHEIWESGMGGAIAQSDPTNPEILRKTQQEIEALKHKIKVQNAEYQKSIDYMLENKEEMRHRPAIRPVNGGVLSGFGWRQHPILGFKKMHTGLDMVASVGTTVYAPGDGTVSFAGVKSNGYGMHIDLNHGYGYETKFGHLSKILVREGQKVKRGDIIGLTGNSGLSKGPHLHYEIAKDGGKINPIDYFYFDISADEYKKLREAAAVENQSMD